MKHTCIIKPMKGTKGGWFSGSKIKYKNMEYALIKPLQAVPKHLLKSSDELMNQRIGVDTNPFTFNYDDAKDGDSQNEARKFFAKIIQFHQQVYTEGFKNPNLGTAPLFEFEDLAMNHQRNFEMEALTLAAKNKAWNMSYREKVDAYYYYGENPMVSTEDGISLIDHKQLTIRLCGDNVGVVMRRIPYGNTGKTFLEHFVKEYKGADASYVIKTTILKALILRDGEGRPLLKKEGAAIVFGTDIIGSNIDEAASWLNNNPEKKKYLIKMVSQTDTIDADNLDESIQSDGENVDVLEKKASEQDIRDEAKKFKVPFHWNKPVEELIPQIELARPVWKEVENLGLHQKINSMKNVTLDKVKELVANEKKRLEEIPV